MTTYRDSRVSSACSCIRTSALTPTTIYTITKIVPAASTHILPPLAIQNGDFEQGGDLTLWDIMYNYPNGPQHKSFGVISPGCDGSKYAFPVTDSVAANFVELPTRACATYLGLQGSEVRSFRGIPYDGCVRRASNVRRNHPGDGDY